MRRAHLLLGIASLAAGCASSTHDFSAGTDPWETETEATAAEWPAWPAQAGPPAVLGGTRFSSGSEPSHAWAHGRAVVAAPIDEVWGAVQWQPGVLVAIFPDLPEVDCEATRDVEAGYAMSYAVKEIPNDFGAIGRANPFTVHWRGSVTRDASQAITRVQLKAREVSGPVQIAMMRQSIVATPAPGGGTRLEIVRHINAPPPDDVPASAVGWVNAWYQALDAQVHGTREALVPTSYCFP